MQGRLPFNAAAASSHRLVDHAGHAARAFSSCAYEKRSTSAHTTIAVLYADGIEGPSRVAMLLRQNPVAGRAFCSYLAGTASSTGRKAGEPLLCQACLQTIMLTRKAPD